jgi:alpha-galactosidase
MNDSLRVVFIGAASMQWTYTISRDLIVVLSGDSGTARRRPTLVLEDLDGANLEKARRQAQMVADATGNKVRIEATTDQRAALTGADFVVTSLAVGSLEAMQADLEIPYEYGIYQPVGDTVSIGGAIRVARNAPAFVSIVRDMEAVASPNAWLLNLSNPMSGLTRVAAKSGNVNVVGLCHELYGGLNWLCRHLGLNFRDWRRLLKVSVVGINHCGWLQELRIGGKDGFPRLRRLLEEKGLSPDSRRLYDSDVPEFRRENVKIALFLKHGVFPYSGDRHNVEFFTEFVNRETNQGADYGVLLTTIQSRLVEWRGLARQTVDERLAGKKELDLQVSNEAAARIVKAIAVDEPFYDVSNLPYNGSNLPGVPPGAILERMCTYDGRGAHPEEVRPLPPPLQKHLALHAGIIEDVVDASLAGDRDLMIQALRRDPLLKNMEAARIPELWDRVAEKSRRFLHAGFFRRARVAAKKRSGRRTR